MQEYVNASGSVLERNFDPNQETGSISSGNSSPDPILKVSLGSLTLQQFTENLEAGGRQVNQMVYHHNNKRRGLVMPVLPPNPNPFVRYTGHADDLVENVAYALAQTQRNSTGGVLVFRVTFNDGISEEVWYQY